MGIYSWYSKYMVLHPFFFDTIFQLYFPATMKWATFSTLPFWRDVPALKLEDYSSLKLRNKWNFSFNLWVPGILSSDGQLINKGFHNYVGLKFYMCSNKICAPKIFSVLFQKRRFPCLMCFCLAYIQTAKIFHSYNCHLFLIINEVIQ